MAEFAPVKALELERHLPKLTGQYHRLLLLVGPAGSGKTAALKALSRQRDLPYLNLNLTLSQRLLALTARQRPLRVHRVLMEIVDEQPGSVLLLDNIELLFEPSLQQESLACLHSLSRRKPLIAAWPGHYVNGALTYAEPGHPEYHRYPHPEALIVTTS